MILDPIEFEREIRARGLTVEGVIEHSGRHRSVFYRWKAGANPSLQTIKDFNAALEDLSQDAPEVA